MDESAEQIASADPRRRNVVYHGIVSDHGYAGALCLGTTGYFNENRPRAEFVLIVQSGLWRHWRFKNSDVVTEAIASSLRDRFSSSNRQRYLNNFLVLSQDRGYLFGTGRP